MNAGMMDRRITVQTYSTSNNDWNHPVKTWSDLTSVWASKTDKRETEVNELNQTVAITRSIFTIRHLANLSTTARIVYDGDNYEILGIKELGRREGMQITTERRA